MARIQQSIEISVPVHAVYNQLTQFEDYPRFMQDVETVHQLDDTHLHWSARMADRSVEWDAEITERRPDRCIAWRNASGPINTGMLELQPVGTEKARVTLTMECDPGQMLAGQAGSTEAAVAQRLEQDLARFKVFIEAHGTDASTPVRTSAYGAGSEGWDGTEDPSQPVLSSAHNAETRPDEMAQSPDKQAGDGRFSIAEEQNFDQQSDQARRVGRMPQDIGAAGTQPADAMAKSIKQDDRDAKEADSLKQSTDRTVPPSE